MNIILLSGGSGKRLWPLSNDVRSKQFIKLFHDENGHYESMLQRVYHQIQKADPKANIVIATSKSQVSSIHNQLDMDVSISIEPCRRDTFPAILLSTLYLTDVLGVSPQEPVVVCPVDPLVGDTYFTTMQTLAEQAGKPESHLVLMGIEPSYPSEKYGYIIPNSNDVISSVKTFKEKPDRASAENYLNQGALWNAGVFAYRPEYILALAHELLDFVDYYDLFDRYETLEKISFDYAVVEKEPVIQVVRYPGEWKDVGTWNTLTEAMDETFIGEAIISDDCENVHVINELGVPIVAMGLKNVVLAASPEGILVSDKDQSDKIKPYVENLNQNIRFADKSWGSFQVLAVDEDSMTIRLTIKPGHALSYHSHAHRDEVWTILSGEGTTVVDDMEQLVHGGDVIAMQAGCRHTIQAITEVTLIEIQRGEEISVYDKEKYKLKRALSPKTGQ